MLTAFPSPSPPLPALAGLSLSYGLTLNSAISFWARFTAQLENNIIAVERLRQYSNINPEAPAIVIDNRPSPSWPEEGRVEFEGLKVSSCLPPLLPPFLIVLPFPLQSRSCRILELFSVPMSHKLLFYLPIRCGTAQAPRWSSRTSHVRWRVGRRSE